MGGGEERWSASTYNIKDSKTRGAAGTILGPGWVIRQRGKELSGGPPMGQKKPTWSHQFSGIIRRTFLFAAMPGEGKSVKRKVTFLAAKTEADTGAVKTFKKGLNGAKRGERYLAREPRRCEKKSICPRERGDNQSVRSLEIKRRVRRNDGQKSPRSSGGNWKKSLEERRRRKRTEAVRFEPVSAID